MTGDEAILADGARWAGRADGGSASGSSAGRTGAAGVAFELTKFPIAVTSTLTGMAVYVLSKGGVGWDVIPLFAGMLFTACGACALNEVQEWRLDARMARTSARPIPSGRIAPGAALALASALVLSGAAALWAGNGAQAAGLSLFAVLWYNGVYTLLKRRTAFAVVPGALIGAVPPAIGWVAGGEPLLDPRAFVLCFFFFMWQIPHFWLLQIRHQEDYRAAGFKLLQLPDTLMHRSRLFWLWIAALLTATMLIPALCFIPAHRPVWLLLFPLTLTALTFLRSDRAVFSPLTYFPLYLIIALSVST